MIIIGADYHPGFQQIAFVDTDAGEFQERQLQHPEEAEKFYRELAAQGQKVRVGIEASGHARWFERLLPELNFELWIGDAAEIQTKRVRKAKTDREDARLLLRLLLEDRFPRIWVPSWENRDLRQLLWHRHRMVQARTRIMNRLQAVALNEGLREEEVVAGMRTAATGVVPLSSLGEPATTGSAGVAGSTESDDCRAEPSGRSGSGEVSGSPALDDASRGGSADGFGLHTHHWGGRAIWLRQADCQLCRTGAAGEVERESAPAGPYHEAGQLHVALLVGGSGPSYSPQHPGMAQPIFPSEDAAGTENRQGSDGAKTGGSFVLDDAQAMGLRAVEKVRFAGSKTLLSYCSSDRGFDPIA